MEPTGISQSLKSNWPHVLLGVSIFTSTYWVIGSTLNVYYYIITGAIFEVLWLPMLLLLHILPIMSFYFFATCGFKIKSMHFFSFLLTAVPLTIFYSLV